MQKAAIVDALMAYSEVSPRLGRELGQAVLQACPEFKEA
jgi:hypothetical protein